MFSIFRDADQLENVESQLLAMLDSCQQTFALATGATFGELDITDSGDQLEAIDKAMNKTERAIRRELLVHGTVRGAEVDMGLMLTYMSVAKDIERIGDYCKNIWNLAQAGIDLSGGTDSEDLRADCAEVKELITSAHYAFSEQNEQMVHDLIPRIKEDTRHHDEQVTALIGSDSPAHVAVPRALFYRYLKRISSHLSNVLSSVVMPVDRLDFYKKSKAIDSDPS